MNEDIIQAFQKIYEAYKFLLQKKGLEYGLSALQVQILFQLHVDGSLRLSDLARLMNTSKPTISEALRTLEIKMLISRIQQQEDARNQVIIMTSGGKKLINLLDACFDPITQILDTFPSIQKEQLYLTLLHLVERMNYQQIIVAEKMCFNCSHYIGDKANNHYCKLINKSIQQADLKLQCTDHQA